MNEAVAPAMAGAVRRSPMPAGAGIGLQNFPGGRPKATSKPPPSGKNSGNFGGRGVKSPATLSCYQLDGGLPDAGLEAARIAGPASRRKAPVCQRGHSQHCAAPYPELLKSVVRQMPIPMPAALSCHLPPIAADSCRVGVILQVGQ